MLRRVDVDDDGTWFTFVDRRALKKRKKTELRVVSTGQRIPRDHSRPYAICHTPEFLVREASTGKSAVKGVPERAEPRHPLPDEEEYLIPPVPSDATWREVLLERVGGESPMPHIVLFARSDEGADPEDPDVRVWCENLVDESPWNGIENAWIEDGKVRLEFPITLYYGMPSHLFLDLPTRAPVGAQIRLFREDHRLFGFYVVKQRRAEVASDEVVRVEAALESTGDSIW